MEQLTLETVKDIHKNKLNSIKKKYQTIKKKSNYLYKLAVKKSNIQCKVTNDFTYIENLIKESFNNDIHLISNSFDSPNLVKFINRNYKIKSFIVSTWSLTDYGILALKELSENNINCIAILDVTHSYKWVFSSGAYESLNKNITFKFTENHSKFQLFELENNQYLTISGSMNLSNNPRYENMFITTNKEIYDFYNTYVNLILKG